MNTENFTSATKIETSIIVSNKCDRKSDRNFITKRITKLKRLVCKPDHITIAWLITIFTIIIMIVGILIVNYTASKPPVKKCKIILKSEARSSIGDDSYPQSAITADINKDGHSDIIIANSGSNTIGIFFRKDHKSFLDQVTYSTGSDSIPHAVTVADFNNDQQLDIAVTNYGRNNIGIFLGTDNGTFSSQTTFSTGSSRPLWIAAGDFDDDTHIDLVVVNYGTHTIGIHLGDGQGNFAQSLLISTGFDSSPYAVAVVDLDNDDKLDIILANYGTNNVGIFFGYGNASFENQVLINTGVNSNPHSITTHDLNNDTHHDIIITCSGTNHVGIILGIGNRSFAVMKKYSTMDQSFSVSTVIGDFNKDNKVDIVVINYMAGNIGILFGHGNGTFTEHVIFFTNSDYHPYSIITSDFNNDTYLDIAVVDYDYNYLDVILTYRSYTFSDQKTYRTTGFSSKPESILFAHFDNDDQLDMVVANYWQSTLFVFLRYNEDDFSSHQTYSTGNGAGPCAMTSADFNNDNQADIAVANYWAYNIGIFLNNGNGTFSNQITYSTGSNSEPFAIATGNFNNDKWIDIVVVNYWTGNIGIFLGSGNGYFSNQITYSLGPNSQPFSVIVNDFNNNNCSDIAVAEYGTNSISVFIGYGNGRFSKQVKYSTGKDSGPQSLTAGDMNGDNLLDIIVANYDSNSVGILRGYDNGTFELQNTISTGDYSGPRAITVVDFNNDALLDIVIANYLGGNLGIFLGRGNSSFSNQVIYSTGSDSQPYSITIGDINNDGLFDIGVANYGTNSAGLFIGYGNGSFSTQKTYSTRGDSSPNCVTVGDLNNDYYVDLIVANYWSDSVEIFLNNGDGTFYSYMTYFAGANSSPYFVAIADFNGDNKLDIAVTNSGTSNIGIFLGNGDGTFTSQRTYPTGSYSQPCAAAIRDIDNDTNLDIVVANYGISTISIFLGYGNGTFATPKSLPSGKGARPGYIGISDLNNDGRLDIVVIYYWSSNVGIFLGCGNGSFLDQILYQFPVDDAPYSGTVGDVNHDDRPDILVTFSFSRSVVILLGNGDGTFIHSASYSTGGNSRPRSVVIGDWNKDNKTDIAVANCVSNNVFILLGDDNGTFIDSATYSTGEGSCPQWIAIGDFNNDSLADIVVTNTYTNTLGVLLGLTYITAIREDIYSTGISPHPRLVALGDFNHDDQLDIALVNYELGDVGILLGHTNGTFPLQTKFYIDHSAFPTSLAIGYLNNDTYLDIAVANSATENVAILHGYGNGSFTQPSMYATGVGSFPLSVLVNDLNNDKVQDIVVANAGTDNVFTFLKYDTGAFRRHASLITGNSSSPRSVSVGDFNKDGRLDFVVVNSGNDNIGVYLGLGDGTFSNQTTYSTGRKSNSWSLIVYDINNDEYQDIIVANFWTDNIGIFLGRDNGTFSEQIPYYTGNGSGPLNIAIGDLDNDTRCDIVVPLHFVDRIIILYGYANGNFSNQISYSTGNDSRPDAVALGNLNHDNYLDIVVANYKANNIGIFYGHGNRTFSNIIYYSTGNPSNPRSVVIVDLNKDGNMDIVVANSGADNVAVFFGRSDGFTFELKFFVTGTGSAPYQAVVIDVNSDNQLDIIIANYGQNNMGVLLGCINGSFFNQITYTTGDSSQPWSVAIGDFNNDTRLDTVITNYGINSVNVYLGYVNHDFLSAPAYSIGESSQPTSIASADFNNDNQLDVIVANNGTNNVMILFGTGYGTFYDSLTYPTGNDSHPCWAAIGDFNNDTRWDFVVANSGTDSIGVFLANNNTGLFSSQVTYSTGLRSRPYSVAVLDFNNDTRLDIAVARYGANGLSVFYGNGNGSFMNQETFPTGFDSHPYSLAIGDINNDHLTDVIATNNGYGNINILMKTC